MTNRYVVMVLTEPTAGKEADFNDYYENIHLEEVLATTRLMSAQRFKLADEVGQPCPLPYLAVYEAEADDPAGVIANLNETRGEREQSDALNTRTAGVWVFEQIGPKHRK